MAVMFTVAAPFVAVGPAYAGITVAPVPDFPGSPPGQPVVVGQTFTGRLNLFNGSTFPDNQVPLTLSNISFIPACSSSAPDCPGAVDPGVFQLGATGVGGDACAGTSFTITQISPGVYAFTPPTPVILNAGQTCTVDFPVLVAKVPTVDAFPGIPGTQTNQVATVTGTEPNGQFVRNQGVDTTSVVAAPLTGFTTQVAPVPAAVPPAAGDIVVAPGTTFADRATVTGVANGPVPSGAVTFTVFADAPGAAPCSGPSTVFAPVTVTGPVPAPPAPPTASATSPTVTAAAGTTYRFVASYGGDPNYNAQPNTTCGTAGENVAAMAVPTLATVATTTGPGAGPGAGQVGGTVTDTATVTGTTGLPAPSGSVTFTRFVDAPGAAPCTGPSTVLPAANLTAVAPATVPPSSTATSTPFTLTGPGTVRFVASYSGDPNYAPLTNSACGAPGENVAVQAPPALSTLAVSSNPADPAGAARPGATVSDTATVTGVTGAPAPTGSVTFTQFFDAPGGAPCSGPSTVLPAAALTAVAPATTPPSSTAGTPAFTPPGGGTVRYTASYSGDANYTPLPASACGAPGENVVVMAVPTLATLTTTTGPGAGLGAVLVGGGVVDTATVTGTAGGPVPTGTVTFTRFVDAPGGAPCSGPSTVLPPVNLAPASPATVPPSATASTGSFSPTGPGTVRFVASYSGDPNYISLPNSACAAPGENVSVQAPPALVTLAASSNAADPAGTARPGATVSDTATVTGVTGAPAPTGTVTFTRFFDAPGAAPCSGASTVLGPVTLAAVTPATTPPSSTAGTPAFTPSGPGTVRFTASYSGDTNYSALPATACGATGENVAVQGVPALSTLAATTGTGAGPGAVQVGGAVADTATVTGTAGGAVPTGTVTFTRFVDAPGAAACSGPSTVVGPLTLGPASPATNPPSATVTTPPFSPTGAGTVRFIASYSGDASYAALPNTPCGAAGENVTVKASPALTTVASAGAVGSSVSDTATLTGGSSPTGTIRFDLFNNETCTAPAVFSSTRPVTASGVVTSESFILPAPGTYHFVATYSGDANNAPAGPTACLDPAEAVGAGRLPSALSTTASGAVSAGNAIFDTATLGGATSPTGTITFNLFGPDDPTCARPAIFTSVKPVNGNANYASDSFTATAAGTYQWVATYSGDANNAGAATQCNDPKEQVAVTPLPSIAITKTATPLSLPEPGGTFTFDLVVTNTSNVALTIRTLTDSIYGDVTTIPGSTCNTAIGTVLQPSPGPGNTYACRFPGVFRGPAGAQQTDVVTVTATDSRGNTVRASANATVTITPAPPAITTTKTADPSSLPEPGGTFTFNYSVTNTGPVPVTVTRIVDSVYGDLNGRGTCRTGTLLNPTETYRCTFTGNFTGDAGAVQTDVITTTARDARGNEVVSEARATVSITNVLPSITIVKTPDPTSLPEPGGTFRFTVKVTNTSFEPITTTSLVDNIYGDLNGRGTCAVGVRLAANGGTYTCSFDGDFRGRAGDSQTDTVTVVAVDNENTSVTAKASATVTLTPAPRITTTKFASPPTLPEPGGTFTFTYTVTNTGPEPVTVTSIVDDVYGNLNGRGTCAIGARLAANGGTYSCTFTGSFFGNAGAAQTDTILTTARNDRGDTVTSQALARVALTNVPPSITIVKTPDPTSRPEPGGSFRFTVKVTNTSFEPITTTSLVDNIYGDLNGRGSCSTGVVLAANGGSYSCAFDGNFFGRAGDSQTDTVTVIAIDNDNTTVTAKASATVTLTPVATPPVFQPPPAPPAVVVQSPAPVQQVLVRTGSDALRQARLAGIFLFVGLTLVVFSWRFGDGGPGLNPAPAGPGGGPGGGGGPWTGDGNWFGGARVEPPRGPAGGLGLAAPPPAPAQLDGGSGAVGLSRPPTSAFQAVPERAGDRWAPPPPTATGPRIARPEAVVPEFVLPEFVLPDVVQRHAVVPPEVVVPEAVVPVQAEVVVPTVVQVRATTGLDAAALDAANAAPYRPPAAPPGGRRSRKSGGR
jgi:hypothetical protein